jgi:hypothetical protein
VPGRWDLGTTAGGGSGDRHDSTYPIENTIARIAWGSTTRRMVRLIGFCLRIFVVWRRFETFVTSSKDLTELSQACYKVQPEALY